MIRFTNTPFRPLFRLSLALLAIGMLVGCTRRTAPPPSMADIRPEDAPDEESWDVRLLISEGDRERVHIAAGYMARFEEEDSAHVVLSGNETGSGDPVVVTVFDEEGDSTATITALQVRFVEDDNRYEALGDVHLVTVDDRRLETEHLIWLEKLRRLRTDEFVRIFTPMENIQGYELDADEDLESYTLARVTGQVTVEE